MSTSQKMININNACMQIQSINIHNSWIHNTRHNITGIYINFIQI